MRIWDIPPEKLCRNHLLGEHSELHALWNILTQEKRGFSKHPETLRWKGKLKALYLRHQTLVKEMKRRGYNHKSSLDEGLASGSAIQTDYVDPAERQIKMLRTRNCKCKI